MTNVPPGTSNNATMQALGKCPRNVPISSTYGLCTFRRMYSAWVLSMTGPTISELNSGTDDLTKLFGAPPPSTSCGWRPA
eukprot:2440801-Prymnesium_polylepis.1